MVLLLLNQRYTILCLQK